MAVLAVSVFVGRSKGHEYATSFTKTLGAPAKLLALLSQLCTTAKTQTLPEPLAAHISLLEGQSAARRMAIFCGRGQ